MSEMVNPSFAERIQRVGKRHLKRCYYRVARPEPNPLPVFVLGYGRSGTTMLIDALEHDWRIEVFQENDPRMARDYEIDWSRIGTAMKNCGAPVALFKPILNSFDITKLLDLDSRAVSIWMFRDVDPVVRSSLKKFGDNVVSLLKDLVTGKSSDSWLGRGMPACVLAELRSLDHGTFSPEDWMALVWWSVNRTLTDAPPSTRRRIQIIEYDRFLQAPAEAFQIVYSRLNLATRSSAAKWISTPSSSNARTLPLSENVRAMCSAMREQIKRQYLNDCTTPSGEHRDPSTIG